MGQRAIGTLTVNAPGQPSPSPSSSPGGVSLPLGAPPCDPDLGATTGPHGMITLGGNLADYAERFPAAARLLGGAALQELGGCSRIVGMACPGLRSLFSRLTLTVVNSEADAERAAAALAPDTLAYATVAYDERFRLARMRVDGRALYGAIEAFAPPKPVVQASLSALAKEVSPASFTGQRALIVGGSRGLGALTGKLLAAGGAEVTLTFAAAAAEAQALVDEITAGGGRARAIRFDLETDAATTLLREAGPLTHLYYFATPPIARAKDQPIDPAVLHRFTDFYLGGFVALCEAAAGLGWNRLALFYPSSVFVEDHPKDLTEYAMIKAAGEVMSRAIPRLYRGFTVLSSRLPRLPTEQTASLVPQKLADPVLTMLPILRELHAAVPLTNEARCDAF